MSFWRAEFSQEEISLIFDKIRPHRIISSDGKVSVSMASDIDSWIAILISASAFDAHSDAIRTRIIKGALFSPDLETNFSEKEFRDVVYRLRHKYQVQQACTYKVVFPIWNAPAFLTGTKRIDDVHLNFSPSRKSRVFKKIIKERNEQSSKQEFQDFFSEERLTELQKCSICIAHVKASSPEDANERASEAVYGVLGLVNIAKDAPKHSRISSRVFGKLPVSEILIGPHTTTHFENGSLTHNGFWYEEWIGGPKRPSLNAERRQAWEKRYLQLTKGVSKSRWRTQCKLAAARYFKAFSNPNMRESFLEGWRLLESIAGPQNDTIDVKISRASNIFEDNTKHKLKGKHLKLRRNLIAHGQPIASDDEETLAFQMLVFVLPLLERFILNGFSFETPGEFWELLDLPPSKDERETEQNELHRRLSLFDKAARFYD